MHNECVRTTSAVEGYNSYLCAQIPTHGNFWDFLQIIKQEEFQKYTELQQALDGVFEISERPRKWSKDRSTAIKQLTSKLNLKEISTGKFLNMMTNTNNNFSPTVSEIQNSIDESDSSESEPESHISDSILCEICFKNKKDTVMKPCKHAKLCRFCFDAIKEKAEQSDNLTLCPFCRQIVGQVEEIYI